MKENRLIPYLIVFIPLALVLLASFFIGSFYLEKVAKHFNFTKEQALKEHLDAKRAKSLMWTKQLDLLFDYRYKSIEEEINQELLARVNLASRNIKQIHEKYKNKKSFAEIQSRIIDTLGNITDSEGREYIFATDYNGNSLLLGSQKRDKKYLVDYMDADARSIILEELHLARKKGEAILHSRDAQTLESELILVRNLEAYRLIYGTSIRPVDKQRELKSSLLEMVQSIPVDKGDFIAIFDAKTDLYVSSVGDKRLSKSEIATIKENLQQVPQWHERVIEGYQYYTTYSKDLDWYLVYGFDTFAMSSQELQKQKKLEKVLDEEFDLIIKISALIVIFVMTLSLLLSRKINKIFNHYQNEVEKRRAELQELNKSLEERVANEIHAHRQKDKMLIQQSKMAEMGDMMSMIAHQWRQPLNQISYVFMNIDSAYEYKELSKEYLELKIKEGNEQLEFMSATIDDFRNYFRPDKEKEAIYISDVVKKSIALMQNSLDMSGIEIEQISQGNEVSTLYKNEFMQVLLNLIKNAKDALLDNKTQNPKIVIKSKMTKESFEVLVCDNGGGIEEAILEKIFDPYFSTKDKKQGTGLGLYMSKMIIDEHLGGKLSVYNTKHGACFKIEI
ncbi:MAG: cache domain-containing protein [Sulfurimonas sp.]|nr:cache domain-containing protein [Sulfurimonas sp.]